MEKSSKNSYVVLGTMSVLSILSAVSYPQISKFSSLVASFDAHLSNALFRSKAESSRNLTVEYAQACPTVQYVTRIFSYDPLIIYIEDFVTPFERRHILNLVETNYSQSTVASEVDGDEQFGLIDSDVRNSQTAYLPFDEPVADCLLQRAADFQGGLPIQHMEPLQVVKYAVEQKFDSHFDYGEDDFRARISTFFVYAECIATNQTLGRCIGGETWFPNYEEDFDLSWCEYIDCEDKENRGGVAFKAIPGNAVFWSNMHANGTAYHEGVLHAGLPVESGQKTGINIWTRNGTSPWTGRGLTPDEIQEHALVREEEAEQLRQEKDEKESRKRQIWEIKEKLRLLRTK